MVTGAQARAARTLVEDAEACWLGVAVIVDEADAHTRRDLNRLTPCAGTSCRRAWHRPDLLKPQQLLHDRVLTGDGPRIVPWTSGSASFQPWQSWAYASAPSTRRPVPVSA
jgi:hypothetical protein